MVDNKFLIFAKLANRSYDAPLIDLDKFSKDYPGYSLLLQRDSTASGYNGLSAYNKETNTLVIASGGTDDKMDWYNDLQLFKGDVPLQVNDAFFPRAPAYLSLNLEDKQCLL